MKKNMTIFRDGDDILPTLYEEMTLVEAIGPILFICRDGDDRLYLCACHCANGQKREWIIAPSQPKRLTELLRNQITIREALSPEDGMVFLVTLYAGETVSKAERKHLDELPDKILPTAGYYMDSEEGEFDAEIARLEMMTALTPAELGRDTRYYDSFYYFSGVKVISVTFGRNMKRITPQPARRHRKKETVPVMVGV